MAICKNPPSPALWFSTPAILAVLALRVCCSRPKKRRIPQSSLSASNRSQRFSTEGRINWTMMSQYSSVATIVAWIMFECASFTSFCKFPCEVVALRTRSAAFASANFSQYMLYFAKWKRVDKQSLGVSKVSRSLSVLIGVLVVINVVVALLIVANGSYEDFECEFDANTQGKIAIFTVLDNLIGILFLCIFIRPLCVSQGILREQNQNANIAGPDMAKALGKVINANLAGALLSQLAQSTILVLIVLTPDRVLVHATRFTTFLNVLGISVMFRDTDKVWANTRKGIFVAARRTRVCMLAVRGKQRVSPVAACYRDDSSSPRGAGLDKNRHQLSSKPHNAAFS